MDHATQQRVTQQQELAPYLACHSANPSLGRPPEGWSRAQGGGTDRLPEEHFNAALWEIS